MVQKTELSPSLFAFVWPTFVTYFAFSVLEFSDVWMAGRLGKASLAAMMASQQILLLLFTFGVGLFSGVNVYVSQCSKNWRSAGGYGAQGLWLALGLGMCVSQLTWISAPLFSLLGHSPDVQKEEVEYFQIAVLALPFQYGSLSLANFFLGVQRPKLALTSGLAQVITNIVISWFLMFGFGEFGGWGIKGAAMGTVVASAIGVAILLFYYLRTSSREMYQTDAFGIHRERMRIVLHVGIPRGILTLSDMFFWTIAMVVYMGTFGTEHLAASAAMYAVVMLFAVPGDGVNEALITVVSFFRSRNREESAVGKLRSSLWINGGLAVILGILMFHFSERIVSWFSTDELVIRIGATLFFFVPWLLMSEAVIASLDGWLTAFEDVRFSTQVTVVSSLLIVVAGGYLMQRYGASYGALGIWLLITLNRMTVAACLHLRFRSGLWHSQPLGSAG